MLRNTEGEKMKKDIELEDPRPAFRCFTIAAYSNPKNYIFQAPFIALALLLL